jgi:plastocyanin
VRAALLAAAAATLVVACSGGGGNDVTMGGGQRFEPATITVAAGEAVTWMNEGSEAHTVTAYEDGIPQGGRYFASGGFASEKAARDNVGSGLLEPGATFGFTFEEPGAYRYFCIPHESSGMRGRVIVES